MALGVDGSIAPDWSIGMAAGLGGLAGGYLGARWSHLAPERALRLLLGALAIARGGDLRRAGAALTQRA